jgi:plasmid stability protein
MSKMIQIRHVPDALHRQLKARAASRGQSLSDFLLAEVRRISERPTREDMIARLALRAPVKLRTSAAEVVRRERESR